MYAIIRRYKSSNPDEIVRKVQEEFVPIIRKAPGFKTYYVVNEGNGVFSSISIFEDRKAAEHSNKLAAEWVMDHSGYLPEPPEISSGEVAAHMSS